VERVRRNFFSALVVCALAVMVACGNSSQTPTPAPPQQTVAPTRRPIIIPTIPPGWTPYSRSNFQIALPNTWQEVKLGEAGLKAAIAAAQESNPPLVDALSTLLSSGQYKAFTFYAIDKNNATSLENVSIARVALDGSTDFATFAKSYADALPNVVRGAKVIQAQPPTRINGMNAAVMVYDVSLVNQTGDLATLRGVQYLYLLDSGDAYLVTVTGDGNNADAFMPLAQQIGTSFVAVTP
jgi:hypothetical protein